MRWDPLVRLTARRAALVLATTDETRVRLEALGSRRVRVFPPGGLPDDELRKLGQLAAAPTEPFRLLSAGRLLHWKGFALGLEAFATSQRTQPDAEYLIIGDGPELSRLRKLATELGVADRVFFPGFLPRTKVIEELGRCHALVHPSLHESGGWVCLEAMAASRPVICLDLGGPGLQVAADAGIKIPASTPKQTVRDLAAAFRKLEGDPATRARLGRAGRRHVERNFRWSRKARFYQNLAAEIALSP